MKQTTARPLPIRIPNHNQTLVRCSWKITVNHSQTQIRPLGTSFNHNQTLVRDRGKITVNHNQTIARR